MKKSFIRNGLLLLSAMTLIACSGSGQSSSAAPASSSSSSSDSPSGSFDPSEHEESGKVFFYFTLTGDVTIPEYCGIYLTGAFNEWGTAIEDVAVMTKIEGNVYGGSFEVDGASLGSENYGYQLTLGYNAASGSPTTGVNWSYKSDECQAASGESGTENASFTMNSSNLSANLGNHTWSKTPSAVTVVEDIDVSLTFAAAVPERIDLYMPGNFINNWATDAEHLEENKMTPDTDRKVFTIHIDKINLGTFEGKIIAEHSGATALTWKTTVLDNGSGGNFTLAILKKYGGSVYDLNDEFTSSNSNFTLNEDGDVVVNWDTALPVPEPAVDVTFEVTFAKKTDAKTITAKGDFDGWGAGAALTSSEDGLTWTSTSLSISAGSDVEFGLPLDDAWNNAIKAATETTAEDGTKTTTYGNFKVTLLDAACTIKVAVDEANCDKLAGHLTAAEKGDVAGTATVVAVETPAA